MYLNAPLLPSSTIFITEKVKQLFSHCYKNPLFISRASNISPKSMDFFEMSFTSYYL